MNNLPIGIFDSGVGGLTVLEKLVEIFPNETFIYLGDNLNIPYGSKPEEIIFQLMDKNLYFFLKKNIKMLVIACNTVSSICFKTFEKKLKFPIIEVINPCISDAIKKTKTKYVAVIGTENTIKKEVHKQQLESMNICVWAKETPLFVPFIEYGVDNKKVIKLVIEEYFKSMPKEVDTLILGCTHYPFIIKELQSILPSNLNIVDSSLPTAMKVAVLLKEQKLENTSNNKRNIEIFFTREDDRVNKKVLQMFNTYVNIEKCE